MIKRALPYLLFPAADADEASFIQDMNVALQLAGSADEGLAHRGTGPPVRGGGG